MAENENSVDLLKLFELKNEGKVAREEYWGRFRDLMLDISNFAILQKVFLNEVNISEGRIRVKLPTSVDNNKYIEMYLNPNDLRSMPFIGLSEGHYEPLLAKILLKLAAKSEIFVDIGANTGFYSISAAKENPTLEIHAIEPQPQVFNLLNENIFLNNLESQITLHNLGIGAKTDELTMFIPKFTGTVGASFKNLHEDEGDAEEIAVKVNTMDNLAISNINLMKIDVEGYESFVLEGAKQTLLENKPTLIVELLRKWMKPFNTTPQEFLEKMSNFGYVAFAIGEDSIKEINKIDENTIETNFIFCHPDRNHLEIVKTY